MRRLLDLLRSSLAQSRRRLVDVIAHARERLVFPEGWLSPKARGEVEQAKPISDTRLYLTISLIGLAVFLRFLFGKPFGVLLLSALLYTAIEVYASFEPFGLNDLTLWSSELEAPYRVALFSALVTITGFVIAFHTATANWRAQMRAKLQVEVADEISKLFGEAGRATTRAELFVGWLIEAKQMIAARDFEAASFHLQWIAGKTQQFVEDRTTLSELNIDVHGITGRHGQLLMFTRADRSFECATVELEKVATAMWVQVPNINLEDPRLFNVVDATINLDECQRFRAVCDENEMAASAGSARGILLAPVVPFNFRMLRSLLSDIDSLRKVIRINSGKSNSKS